MYYIYPDLGQDRLADIIQRGRDHGLPTYVDVRHSCGLGRAEDFHELNNTVDDATIGLLRSNYKHVGDVDLFVGGLAEKPLSGAVVGPTFGCLLGQQFQILKQGDRFWYENNIPPSALTKGKPIGTYLDVISTLALSSPSWYVLKLLKITPLRESSL